MLHPARNKKKDIGYCDNTTRQQNNNGTSKYTKNTISANNDMSREAGEGSRRHWSKNMEQIRYLLELLYESITRGTLPWEDIRLDRDENANGFIEQSVLATPSDEEAGIEAEEGLEMDVEYFFNILLSCGYTPTTWKTSASSVPCCGGSDVNKIDEYSQLWVCAHLYFLVKRTWSHQWGRDIHLPKKQHNTASEGPHKKQLRLHQIHLPTYLPTNLPTNLPPINVDSSRHPKTHHSQTTRSNLFDN